MGAMPIKDLLPHLREWASDPDAVCYPVSTNKGRVIVFPEDVAGRTDDQLLATIRERLNEQ
jgi:hypothetical protein